MKAQAEVAITMNVRGDSVTIDIEGAHVTIPATAIADLWIERIRGGARAIALEEKRTAIGALGKVGIYAGIARGNPYTEDDYVLEVLEAEPDGKLTWDEAKRWAESAGGELPTRKEAALLFANVPELFEPLAYWTCEQYAGGESCAWCQYFDAGGQYLCRKDYELRARAVRRLPIE